MKTFFERVYDVVREIPKGKVTTYGQIATILGHPSCSRAVGYALHANPHPWENGGDLAVPCHRVVNRFGEVSSAFAFGGRDVQRKMLEEEGIAFNKDGKVDLNKFAISL